MADFTTNPYDSVLQRLNNDSQPTSQIGAGSGDAPMASYDDVFKSMKQGEQQRALASMNIAFDANPNKAADVVRLSKITGLPTDTIDRNYDEVRKIEFMQQFNVEELAKSSPILMRQLQDPDFAKMAYKDTIPLNKLEGIVTPVGAVRAGISGWGAASEQQELFQLLQQQMSGKALSLEEQKRYDDLKKSQEAYQTQAAAETAAGYTARSTGYSAYQMLRSIYVGLQGAGYGGVAGAVAGLPIAGVGAVPGGVAGMISGGAIASFNDARQMETVFAWDEFRSMKDETGQKLPDNVARGAANVVGLVNGTIELGSDILLMKLIPGAKQILGNAVGKDAAKNAVMDQIRGVLAKPALRGAMVTALGKMAQGASIEGLEEFFQTLVGSVGRESAQAVSGQVFAPDSLVKDLQEAGGAAMDAAVGTFFTLSPVGAANYYTARKANQRAKAIEQAQLDVQKLKDAFDTAAGVTLRTNSPETFKQLVDNMSTTEDGQPASIFIDGQVLQQAVQALPEGTLERLLPSVAARLEEALQTGSTVEVPVSEVLTAVPGTELEQVFLQNAKSSPEALSLVESQQAADQAQVFLQEEADKVMKQAEDQAAWQTETEGVRDTILTQLNQAGRWTPEVNEAYAALQSTFFSTMANRFGITPSQLYNEFSLKVAAREQAVQQTILDQAREVGRKFEAAVNADDTLVDQYISNFGSVVDPDLAKQLSPEYLADPATMAGIVHEGSSALAKKVYARLLATNPGKVVQFTAGGGGSGKSEAIARFKQEMTEGVLYDSVLGNYDSAKTRIDQALAAGNPVLITYVNKDVEGAFRFSLARDRIVPLAELAKAHVNASNTIRQLAAEYADNPAVRIRVINNLGAIEDMAIGSIDDVYTYSYNDVERSLYAIANEALAAGTIDATKYAAVTRRGGSQDAAVGGVVQEGQRGQDLGAGSAGEQVLAQSVTLRSGKESLKKYGLKPGNRYTTREVAAALESRQRAKYGSIDAKDRSPEAQKRLAKWVVEEVLFEMQHPERSGIGWYSQKFQRALDTMAQTFPELATDEVARNTMTVLIAITSDGQKVVPNFAQAMDIYSNFRANGKFTTQRGHIRQASIDNNLQILQGLYDELGAEGMHTYLMQESTVGELKKIAQERGSKFASSYQVSVSMPMAALELGPKLGAFYANLMGSHGYLTMDRWWSRTFNRYRGTLLQAPTAEGLQRFRQLLGKPELSDEETISATVPYRDAYANRGFKEGSEIEKAANTIYKAAFEALEDSPFNATDRTFMLDVVGQAQKMLKRKGSDISIADIQAILWYYEKRLYSELGARQSADISYEEAAQRVVDMMAAGVNPDDIDAVSVPVGQDTFADADSPSANVVFEVAPDPNDAALTDAWRQLDVNQRLAVSDRVAQRVIPGVLAQLGGSGVTTSQVGSYMDDTNPSFALRLGSGNPLEVAKMIGFVLSQESMMVISDKPFEGADSVGAIDIEIGDKTPAEVDAIYQKLRGITVNGVQPIAGQSTVGGYMTVLNYSDVPTDELRALVDEALSKSYNVVSHDVYAAFPQKEDYDYGTPQGDTRGDEGALRQWADTARSEASAILRTELESTTTYQQSAGGVRLGSGRVLRAADLGEVRTSYGTATANADSVIGVHYSPAVRGVLSSAFYQQGLAGAEAARIAAGDDARLAQRVHFYVDTGNGITPEAGVGTQVHAVNLNNLYNTDTDPLGILQGVSREKPYWFNQVESAIIDAGFDGVFVPGAQGKQGVAVLLGQHALQVEHKGQHAAEAAGTYVPEDSGRRSYSLMSKELRTFKDMRAEIEAAAPSVRIENGNLTFSQEDTQALAQYFPAVTGARVLYQPARGTFNPQTLVIAMGENANLSTFLHESGHFFLEVMADMAARPNAPQQIRDDMSAVLKWFGVQDLATWRAMTLDQKRQHHERFAESFEQYLFEGKAPSIELQSLFRNFREWMTSVYRTLVAFMQGRDLKVSDEIRAVFDRMLATDEQIAQAEEAAGMLPDFEATNEAIEKLQAKSLKDLQWIIKARGKILKQLQKEASDLRKVMVERVRAEVARIPVYNAINWLKKGEAYDIEGNEMAAGVKGAHRLSTEALAQMYPETMLSRPDLTKLRGMTAKDGIHPDMLADVLGFQSGDALVRSIIDAEPMASVVEGITDQRMLEEHGELATARAIEAAANEAIHNEARARLLASELKAQQDALNPREDTGRVNARGARITVNALTEAAKQFALNLVNRRKVKDLRRATWQHRTAETRAGKDWEKATRAGDTAAAVEAKRAQMLNNYVVKGLQEAQAEIRKMMEFFRRVEKGNNEAIVKAGRDPDVVNAMRAMLAAYGFMPRREKGALEYLESVKNNDPAMYAVINESVMAALANARPMTELTIEELRGLHTELQAMWYVARNSRFMEVAGEKIEIDEAAERLVSRMEDVGVPETIPGEKGAITDSQERGIKLRFAKAILSRAEQWAERMDGAYGGPFLSLVFQPIKDAADKYRAARVDYREKFTALVKAVAPYLPKGAIEAPELGYTFGNARDSGAAELLHAILHTGNTSNKRKLLLGRGWATENEDGTLNTQRWDAFVNRMIAEGKLRKEHYDFAQGVWDLLEAMKPLAQETHRRVFGRYFAEVTADKVETPFGNYRGGYVPAQTDARLVSDAKLRELMEGENESMAYAFPAAPSGFTKSRVEYNKPLILDLRVLAQHMDKVLLFSYMQAPVTDVRRLLTRKNVSYALDRIDPGAYEGMLIPWLNRSAKQIVETPVVGDRKLSRFLSGARSRAGMSLMFANLSNTVQQLTGFSLAAVKVKPSLLLSSMGAFTRDPKAFKAQVVEASIYMKDRMLNETSAMNDAIDEIMVDPTMLELGQQWTQRHAYFLQAAVDSVMSPIVWTAAYNQAIGQKMTNDQAIRFADGVVRQTQGSTLPEDISRFETGPGYARLFTQFVSYFNMMANTNATAIKQIVDDVGLRKGAGRLVYVALVGMLVNIWVAEAIATAFRGGPEDPDDDGYLDDWLAAVFGWGTLRGMVAQVPILGQAAQLVVGRFTDKPSDDKFSLSPAVSLIESSAGAPASVYKAIAEDGSAMRAVRDVAAAATLITGLPVYAAARPVSYVTGVAEGKIVPTDTLDFIRGIVTGTASPESKTK